MTYSKFEFFEFSDFLSQLKNQRDVFKSQSPHHRRLFFDLHQNFMGSCYPRQNVGSRLPHNFFFDPYHLRIDLTHAIHEASQTMPPMLPEPAILFGAWKRGSPVNCAYRGSKHNFASICCFSFKGQQKDLIFQRSKRVEGALVQFITVFLLTPDPVVSFLEVAK